MCAGTLTPFGGATANIGVLTAAAHRNQASARRRFLEENRPAVRIARTLGYVEDGRTLEVVLHVPARCAAFDDGPPLSR